MIAENKKRIALTLDNIVIAEIEFIAMKKGMTKSQVAQWFIMEGIEKYNEKKNTKV